jgi:hypothetical protein
MIVYRYVECTSACIQSLSAFRKQYPEHRAQEIESSICRAAKYIESIQRPDGSWCVISSTPSLSSMLNSLHQVPVWEPVQFQPPIIFVLAVDEHLHRPCDGFSHFCSFVNLQSLSCFHGWNRYGSWGVCFTYGTWFGMKGLLAAGRSYETSASIRSACDFLLSKQLASGGWGESYLSCQDKVVSKELLFFLELKVLTLRIFFALTRHMNSLVWLWLKYAACYSVSVCINCCFSSRSTLAWKEINHTLWTRHGQCFLS